MSEIPLTPVELPPVPPGSTTAGCTAADDVLCDWVLEGAAPPAVDMTRLEEIYARPGFEEAASRGADGWERMIAELLGLLESLFGTSGAQGFAEWTRFLVLAAAALLLTWLGVRLVRAALGRRTRAPRPTARTAAPLPEVVDKGGVHLARAHGLIVHAPREGIREGLLGLLSALEGAGLSRPDRVRTNQELARELPDRGASAPTVREVRDLLDWYDRAFYSLARVEPEEARRFLLAVEALVETLPEART